MPGTPNVLELVHRSCSEVTGLHVEHVRIDDIAVSELAAELVAAADDVRGAVRGLPLPIKFSSVEQELTLLALYHLLDFGSGYDKQLQRLPGGRDARETLLYGLIGLHLGGTRLDHHKLKSFSMYDIHQVFGIDATTEVAVMPGVTMSKPGPLQPLCKLMVAVLNETGSILADQGVKTPGELLISVAEGLKKAGRTTASAFVEELVDTLPAFRDVVLYDGRTLTLHRKAQNLAADLAVVHGSRDERFLFPDVDQLTADSGGTTIAVLRAKGVLRLSEELTAILDSGAELPAGPHERALRAAAVTACDRLVTAAAAAVRTVQHERGSNAGKGDSGSACLRAVDVGAYLSYLAEEGRELHGKITKHVTTGITAY
ncbi:hypothetical protein VOLCADRAFT_117089 [Volvox carteri f. nagariensis]|uniref:Queuosine 5'-phosphate N-glycosylase/hydrolase n=1 Tax=Volvox carteri f. nagariensis TaxID=3068 RepID=D8TS72_VOLCA|nr:uncharacterized protein VOLCADRAFT_117089 [Volvox carteri f. nagariensis]EFJ49643.1 hypothetical protein VOLCADRAFT_117089 [Volvox carteri f. nagariensis]|eukprot:XP_002949150.1 hypothetical protein VOLCADRAFT_117089 [Volvox carteri f. nagariensis]